MTDDLTMSTQDRVDAWKRRTDKRFEAIRQMGEKMAKLRVGAVNDEGTIKVTVDAAGSLADLKLHESVMDGTAADLAADILDTLAKARTNLATGATLVLDHTVGADSETGRAVLATFHDRFGTEAAS